MTIPVIDKAVLVMRALLTDDIDTYRRWSLSCGDVVRFVGHLRAHGRVRTRT